MLVTMHLLLKLISVSESFFSVALNNLHIASFAYESNIYP
jgi:hypothetical protein